MVSASQKQKKNEKGVDAFATDVQQHLCPTSHQGIVSKLVLGLKQCRKFVVEVSSVFIM